MEKISDLEEIHLRRNDITSIEACSFCDLPHLHLLNLRANRIPMVNSSLFPMVNSISKLDLSANPLRFMGKEFLTPLSALKQLEMSRIDTEVNVQITVKDGAILPSLTSLDISSSPLLAEKLIHLISEHEDGNLLPKLHLINMRNCHLSFFDGSLQPFFSRLSKIKLAQNPISCSLPNRWMVEMMQSETDKFFKAQELKCYGPKSFKDRKILSLNPAVLRNIPLNESVFLKLQKKISVSTKFVADEYDNSSTSHIAHSNYISLIPSELWIIIVICCVLSAAVVSLFFILFFGYCSVDNLREKKISIRNKIIRIFGLLQSDPYPDRIDSLRTLYSSCNESVYTINSEASSVHPSAHAGINNRICQEDDQNYGVSNRGLSPTSTCTTHSIFEYRV